MFAEGLVLFLCTEAFLNMNLISLVLLFVSCFVVDGLGQEA